MDGGAAPAGVRSLLGLSQQSAKSAQSEEIGVLRREPGRRACAEVGGVGALQVFSREKLVNFKKEEEADEEEDEEEAKEEL